MTAIRPGVVSTIIAVFNRPTLFAEAIDSVLAQTYRPIEIVVIDDGSTDETGDVARAYAATHPGIVRLIERPNGGYPSALNAGLAVITGEFVQILDSDDLLAPAKFRKQVAALRAHPECGISYCYIREYKLGEAWSAQPARRTGETFGTLFPALLRGKIWPNPAPLFRRSVIDDNGPFLDMVNQLDWEYEARAGARGVKLQHCQEFLGDTRAVHHLEGRTKGQIAPHRLGEYALILERILAHARQAGVSRHDLDLFSETLRLAARKCAAEGMVDEAHRLIALAREVADSPASRARVGAYATCSRVFGWQRTARLLIKFEASPAVHSLRRAGSFPSRAMRYAFRRAREAWLARRGRQILRRYTAHYRRAQALYRSTAAPIDRAVAVEDVGVRVVPANATNALIRFPSSYDAVVARVAASVASAFERTANCKFFPPLTDVLPERTGEVEALAQKQVIAIHLRDPFAIDGLEELCQPLVRSIEQTVYGSHVLVDKVYVYRNPISEHAPMTSWRWHYDNHPREMLKLMVYLTDVREDTGPFEYLKERASGRCLAGSPLTPLFGTSRIPTAEVERRLQNGWAVERVVGPRGTVVVFDDNVVHRATMAAASHRDVVVFQIRPAAFAPATPIDSRWTGTFGHRAMNADPWDLMQHPV